MDTFVCVCHCASKHNFLFAMWNKDWGRETQMLETQLRGYCITRVQNSPCILIAHFFLSLNNISFYR